MISFVVETNIRGLMMLYGSFSSCERDRVEQKETRANNYVPTLSWLFVLGEKFIEPTFASTTICSLK